jgi:hypothetical protein
MGLTALHSAIFSLILKADSHCGAGYSQVSVWPRTGSRVSAMYRAVDQFGCGSVYFESSLLRNWEQEKGHEEAGW